MTKALQKSGPHIHMSHEPLVSKQNIFFRFAKQSSPVSSEEAFIENRKQVPKLIKKYIIYHTTCYPPNKTTLVHYKKPHQTSLHKIQTMLSCTPLSIIFHRYRLQPFSTRGKKKIVVYLILLTSKAPKCANGSLGYKLSGRVFLAMVGHVVLGIFFQIPRPAIKISYQTTA